MNNLKQIGFISNEEQNMTISVTIIRNINNNVSVHINPYSFSNLQNNKYNEDFIKNIVSTISLILHGDNSSKILHHM